MCLQLTVVNSQDFCQLSFVRLEAEEVDFIVKCIVHQESSKIMGQWA